MENLVESLLKRLDGLKVPRGILQQWDPFFENGHRKTFARYDRIERAYENKGYKTGLTPEELETWEREGPFSWMTVTSENGTYTVYGITYNPLRERFTVTLYTIPKKTLEEATESAEELNRYFYKS